MKIAIVTGANRGLGAGLVSILADRGYKVYAGMRDTSHVAAHPDNVLPVELDISDDKSIQKLADTISRANESVTLLINNAGINRKSVKNGDPDSVSKLDKLDRRALNEMFDVNAVSPLLMAKHIVPLMTKGGLIVNISSNRASFHDEMQNSSANYGYRASKTALNMFTRALSEDLPTDIYTVAVHPGGVVTDMNPNGPASPSEAAHDLYTNIIEAWRPEMNGTFREKDGSLHPY